MNIALIGYGKMGKAIEEIATHRGHSISCKVNDPEALKELTNSNSDVAIEFSRPESGFENIQHCLQIGLPIVSGTTGWLDRYEAIVSLTKKESGSFFYASNYSVGVNIFFELNKHLARIMNQFDSYDVRMEEIHHTEKLDAPSGTAITLAEGILEHQSVKGKWINETAVSPDQLEIISKRINNVPGTHTIMHDSDVDTIEIKHTAHSRTGFATGAVLAAEFIQNKKGVYGMNDLLKLAF